MRTTQRRNAASTAQIHFDSADFFYAKGYLWRRGAPRVILTGGVQVQAANRFQEEESRTFV
jgi:hypothetical protein